MFKLWGKLDQIAPIFGLCCLFLPSTKVVASESFVIAKQSKINNQNINKQDKVTPRIIDRQDLVGNIDFDRGNANLFFSQVNSVDQLKDIQPTDWSYEALRSLIERYGCINGFQSADL